MSIRYRRWQGIAAIMVAASVSPAWAQLPVQKASPLNQLGRCWGFGISDGYHECPSCPKPTSKTTRSAAVVVRSNSSALARDCKDCPKSSPLARWNPFKGSTESSDRGGPAPTTSSDGANTIPMTVLPPSPDMYNQFAMPHETPLPGSHYPSADMSPTPEPSTASTPPTPGPNLEGPVADPVVSDQFEPESAELNHLRLEMTRTPVDNQVPPPPITRARLKAETPVGTEPTFPGPDPARRPEPIDRPDNSLDLLPKDEAPPITQQDPRLSGQSLLTKSPFLEAQPATQPGPGNDWSVQQYYGNAYSSQQMPIERQAAQTYSTRTLNRYR